MEAKKKPQAPEYLPPDLDMCQVEKPNGNNFLTLGGVPGRVRCSDAPVFVVTETGAGSMTMCAHCYEVFRKQCPTLAHTIQAIKSR